MSGSLTAAVKPMLHASHLGYLTCEKLLLLKPRTSSIANVRLTCLPFLPLVLCFLLCSVQRYRSDTSPGIAFSSAYLAEGRAVPVIDGTTFQLVEVPSGGNLHWTADESRIRLCSVAQGVIRVKLQEKEFPIGPNGMWRVKQGVPCAVVNPFYMGAVTHLTTIGVHGFSGYVER